VNNFAYFSCLLRAPVLTKSSIALFSLAFSSSSVNGSGISSALADKALTSASKALYSSMLVMAPGFPAAALSALTSASDLTASAAASSPGATTFFGSANLAAALASTFFSASSARTFSFAAASALPAARI